jgi:hypothetical protein
MLDLPRFRIERILVRTETSLIEAILQFPSFLPIYDASPIVAGFPDTSLLWHSAQWNDLRSGCGICQVLVGEICNMLTS